MDDKPRALIAYRIGNSPKMSLAAASANRDWMDGTDRRFANRCLPMLIANQAGWKIRNGRAFRAMWLDRADLDGVVIEPTGATPCAASSHFGHGILTFILPFLFRTPPGISLHLRGPANAPKDINPRGPVYFSVLNSHVHIRAHCGPTNARIRLHLGRQVPTGAFMRVGEEKRTWKRGKCLVFDDSWEHEVWNRSDQLRAVLLMDTGHPQRGMEQHEEVVEHRTTNDTRLGEREGWRRPLSLEPAPEGPTGNAETSSGDVFRAMSEDNAMPIHNKALMLRHCGIQFIESAAEYALAALESPAYPGGEQAIDAVTDQTSVWLSLARLFSAGSRNEIGFTDANDVIHLCGISWRSKKRNLLTMYEFDEQWAAQERSAILDKLIGLRSPLGMMSFLADPQQPYNQLPVGDLIPLLVAALRELGCGRSN